MKNSYKSIFILLGLAVLLNACDGQSDSLINERLEDNPLPTPLEVTSGTTDFSTFISIGNSLTAGYMDGALYNLGQQNSIGAMLAEQLGATVDGGITYNQPDINSVNGFNTSVANPVGSTVFGRFKLDTNIPGPSPTINGDPISAYTGPQVHNFGVPGIQVGQLVTPLTGGPAAGNPAFNPFYQRFASDPGTSTILGDAIATQPSFFSLWIGTNDVLGWAVSGAANDAILTDDATFQAAYGGVIDNLMAGTSADGVVADIPFFLGLAFFQAVQWNAIPLDDATASALNAGVASINGAIQGCAQVGVAQADIDRRLISYAAGSNPILVIDEELDDLGGCFDALQGAGALTAQQRAQLVPYEQSRPLVAGELVVLGAGSVLNTPFGGNPDQPIGIVIPLGFNTDGSLSGDQYYLTLGEQVTIETKRQTFNAMIAGAIAPYSGRIALYETGAANSVFLDIFGLSDGVPGITVDGVNLAPDFSPNGVVSTDGVHPNYRGNAIIANQILEVIESKFGATLPSVNTLDLPSVIVCGIGDCLSEQ